MSETVLGAPRNLLRTTDAASLGVLTRRFDEWLDANAVEMAPLGEPQPDHQRRNRNARRLQQLLFEGGWAQCGWPESVGGVGGSIFHRAALFERLTERGFASFAMFEHVEILLPSLIRFATPEFRSVAGPGFLSGQKAWSQGFSEPDAGSDLASLRTIAERDGESFRIDGRKIWTSWASDAEWCLVLARTGSAEQRHRGLSAIAVDLDQPGVEVSPIRQANGASELAEVVFDGAVAGPERLIGELDGGWAVAMDVLVHERGTFAWFRHCMLLARLRRLAAAGLVERADVAVLGELLADMVSLRAAAIGALLAADRGDENLAAVSTCKLQLADIEQRIYDLAVSTFGSDLVLGLLPGDLAAVTLEEFQFSRIVSIYGGSQQMQLNAIARQVLGL